MMRNQRLHVDRAARDQLEPAAGDTLRIGQRAVDVELASHDGGQIELLELAARPGRAAQHDPPAAPRELNRLAGGRLTAGKLDHHVSSPPAPALAQRDARVSGRAVDEVVDDAQALDDLYALRTGADQGNPPGP